MEEKIRSDGFEFNIIRSEIGGRVIGARCIYCDRHFGRKPHCIRHCQTQHPERRLSIDVISDDVERQRVLNEEAAESKRIADEEAAESKRIADEEAAERQRIADEEDAERQRIAAKEAERKRIADEEAAERQRIAAKEAERQRIAAKEAERQRIAAEEAERQRIAADEAERRRIAASDAMRQRVAAEEAERQRIAAEEAERQRVAAEETERQRIASEETERQRVAAEDAERQRIADAERALLDEIKMTYANKLKLCDLNDMDIDGEYVKPKLSSIQEAIQFFKHLDRKKGKTKNITEKQKRLSSDMLRQLIKNRVKKQMPVISKNNATRRTQRG